MKLSSVYGNITLDHLELGLTHTISILQWNDFVNLQSYDIRNKMGLGCDERKRHSVYFWCKKPHRAALSAIQILFIINCTVSLGASMHFRLVFWRAFSCSRFYSKSIDYGFPNKWDRAEQYKIQQAPKALKYSLFLPEWWCVYKDVFYLKQIAPPFLKE